MSEKYRNWFPSILAGLALTIELAFNILGFGIHVALWLTVLLLVVQIIVLQHELVEIKSKRPNIVVDGFKLERPFHLIRGGHPNEMLERYYILFRNIKEQGKTICDTRPIHAIVSFYNSDFELIKDLSHEDGFWLGKSGPPWERSKDHVVTIRASSKPEGLCLVVKKQGASDLFVFCDKSYNSNFKTLEPFQDYLKISHKKFY